MGSEIIVLLTPPLNTSQQRSWTLPKLLWRQLLNKVYYMHVCEVVSIAAVITPKGILQTKLASLILMLRGEGG